MLQAEDIEPRRIAYDRPSPKLISFLKKHYGLEAYIPQNNNFIVYNDYFNVEKKIAPKKVVAKTDYQTQNNYQFNSNAYEKKKDYRIEESKGEEIKKNVKANYKNNNNNDYTLSPLIKPVNSKVNDNFNAKYSSAQTNRNDKKKNDMAFDYMNSQFGNMKINQKTDNNKNVGGDNNNNNKRSPWAIDNSASAFPTSSSIYGAHYFIKNK